MDSAHTATILPMTEGEISNLPCVASHRRDGCYMSEMYSIEQGVLICSTCMKYVHVIKNLGENLVQESAMPKNHKRIVGSIWIDKFTAGQK
jgi:hypothetical protein